jgi:hypothetical protein
MNDFGGLFPLVVVAFRAEDRLDGFRERFVFGGESVAEPSGFNRSRPFVPVLTKERIRISLAQKLEEVGRFRFKRSIYSTRECIGHYRFAAPTPEHLLPVNYIVGLAAAANESAEILVAGYAMGSVSMTSYIVH